MTDDQAGAVAAVRRLPPAALAGLREAFAAEVSDRLPRLRDAAASGDPDDLGTALRDAHSLGSSAVVVGEPDVSRAARSVEQLLLEWQAGSPPELSRLRDRVDALATRLEGWRP